ncbi:glycogen synthesis protein GlgS [Pantoea sp. App145]|uniref:glycogen synthesis protein GlgS n=1 Tax=Pantoea sp. App145 TaxID=3071567 RepID=UPI003A80A904
MQTLHNAENFYPEDFDFIAVSLARMNYQGRKVNVDQVAAGMSEACRLRFLDNYRNYLSHFTDGAVC